MKHPSHPESDPGAGAQQASVARRARGFSLIEVLVALVVLSFGLLGVAALMMTSVKTNDSSTMRTRAALLTNTIIDSMKANLTANINGNHFYDTTSLAGTSYTAGCTSSACSTQSLAQTDEANWKTQLASSLPSGDVVIQTATSSRYTTATITVYWDDSRATTNTGISTQGTCSGAPTGTNMCLTVESLLE